MSDTDRMVCEWRRMTTEEIEQLVRLLTQLPVDAGFMLTKTIDMPGAPLMVGAYYARLILSGGGTGVANDDNPARALRAAWGLAHLHASEILLTGTERK